MSNFARFSVGLLLVASAQPHACAEPLPFDRYKAFSSWPAAEQRLLHDLSDARLDDHSLLSAALIVAGHDTQQIAALKSKLTASLGRFQPGADQDSRPRMLRRLFQHLNHEFLSGEYQADLYDVGRTIQFGDFNCLTATILFHWLCQAHSIEVQAVWEPSHVQCWVKTSESSGHLVETTASDTALAVSPIMDASQLVNRCLSIEELVAKVYYNRGVRQIGQQDFEHAMAATWASRLLDPYDEPAENNLLACFNNWALKASEQQDFELARRLLEAGIELAPDYQPFVRNKAMLPDP